MAKSTHLTEPLPEDKVRANPTKGFFVTMLTRDIALMDAIMDLIDNCIDGVHRKKGTRVKNADNYNYKGFYAEITLNESVFQVKDNCGGIPVKVAKEYAFKMGRSEEYKDDDKLETLGMYGIGMKRAIFKIGLKADVITMHNQDMFKVTIPENWVSQTDWYFDFENLNKQKIAKFLKEPGTVISISKLHSNISKQFGDKDGFIKDLKLHLKNHYGYIIQQGFRIVLNGIQIGPIQLNILTSSSKDKNHKGIIPYVYRSKIDDVDIEIIIGFYRPPASDEEISKELDGSLASSLSENAGVTVLCNDRVVLYCDKTFLTGWGEPPVPKYHTQFISIAGVVHFRSNNPIKLPVTTTKRGLDTSSPVYATSKNKIKDGLKFFTSFTNNWKKATPERTQLFKNTKPINALKPGQSNHSTIKLERKKGDSGKYQIPILPRPANQNKTEIVVITYSKERMKIKKMIDFYMEGDRKTPSEVGAWCFDTLYNQAD